MPQKWYQSRTIQASIISGIFVLILGILTTPLWLRKSKEPSDSKEEVADSEEKIKKDTTLNPISIEIEPDISNEKVGSVLTEIRKSRNLRELTPLESGKSITKTPYGTYFFLPISFFNISDRDLTFVLENSPVRRIREYPDLFFEVHYISESKIFILAFISSGTASLISKLDGSSRKEIILFSYPGNQVDTLILLPLNRIIEAKYREIQNEDNRTTWVLDAIIQ